MFHFKRKAVERSDKVVEEGERIEMESGNLSKDNQDFISGSMLPVAATITITSDPENSESEHSSDKEFIFHPMPFQRYSEYLKRGLITSDFSTSDQTDASEDEDDSSDDDSSDDDSSDDDSSDGQMYSDLSISDETDASEGNSYNIYINDCYNSGSIYDAFANYVSLQRAEKQNEYSFQDSSEESEKLVEGKEEQEEEHKESKARSQCKDEEHPLSGSTLVDDVTISASRDPEIDVTNEQSSNEIIVEVQDNLSLIPSPDLDEKVEADPCPRCCSYFCFPCFPL